MYESCGSRSGSAVAQPYFRHSSQAAQKEFLFLVRCKLQKKSNSLGNISCLIRAVGRYRGGGHEGIWPRRNSIFEN